MPCFFSAHRRRRDVWRLAAVPILASGRNRIDRPDTRSAIDPESSPATLATRGPSTHGSHHWGRELARLGHSVRLVAPQHAKPFLKRGKNDRADAEAISEAASRPSMRFVPVKSAETQASTMAQSVRQLLVGQRTALVNALRGHASEFGLVVGLGTHRVGALLTMIAEAQEVPELARELCAEIGADIDALDARIAALDRRLAALHKDNPVSRLLTTIPGIGPVAALALTTAVDPARFSSGRAFAAFLGLTPKDHSSGGKQRLGGISRAGDERLRELLVLGATSVLSHAVRGKGARGAGRECVADAIAGAQAAQGGRHRSG